MILLVKIFANRHDLDTKTMHLISEVEALYHDYISTYYRSAFFYFCQELRGKMRELHPEMGVGDIAKELGKLWMSTDLQTKSKYMAIAEEDRARYERVCCLYRNMRDIWDDYSTNFLINE